MTPTEIYEDMVTRCWEVDIIERTITAETEPGRAVGHMIFAPSGHLLVIEVGIDDSGRAFAGVRMFGPDCEALEFDVFNANGSVMAVTPEVDTCSQ